MMFQINNNKMLIINNQSNKIIMLYKIIKIIKKRMIKERKVNPIELINKKNNKKKQKKKCKRKRKTNKNY